MSTTAEYTIYREFPTAEEGDFVYGEYEIGIEAEVYHEKEERMTRDYPGSPGGYSVEGWEPVSLNGQTLSSADSKALRAYMAKLTDDEQENMIQQHIDNAPEPDFDDSY